MKENEQLRFFLTFFFLIVQILSACLVAPYSYPRSFYYRHVASGGVVACFLVLFFILGVCVQLETMIVRKFGAFSHPGGVLIRRPFPPSPLSFSFLSPPPLPLTGVTWPLRATNKPPLSVCP